MDAARSLKRIGVWPWRSIHHLYRDHVRLVKLSIVRDAARTDEQIKKKRKERKKERENQIIYKRTSATAVLGSVSMEATIEYLTLFCFKIRYHP